MNIVASLFNLAGPDLIVILLIVLLLFGAKRLPELARGLGQAVNEFNKAKDDLQRQISRADEPTIHAPSQSVAQNPPTQAPAAPAQEQPKQA
jgi:sec-independent protein translocase protein TatA